MSEKENLIRKKPFFIGIAGGSGSGKTSIANIIYNYLGRNNCLLFSMDTYYKDLTEEQQKNINEYNFDCPDALDFELLNSHISSLLNWENINMPTYDFATSSRGKETIKLEPNKIILFEGILAFYDKRIRDLMDIKIFVDLDGDIRLSRRIYRDIIYRGREMKTVIDRYHKFVKPAYDIFIKPTRKFADVIIPKGGENTNAIVMIALQLKHQSEKLFPNGIKHLIKKENDNEENNNTNINNINYDKSLFKKEEILKIKNEDLFDVNDNENYNKIDKEILKKIFIDFLLKKNKGYSLLFRDIIINNLIKLLPLFCKENSNLLIIYSNLENENIEEEINNKTSNNIIKLIIIFIPFLINENSLDDKLNKLINILKTSKKEIYLASVYTSLDIKNKIIKEYEIKAVSVYCGNKLKVYNDYIEKGGIDYDGEIAEKYLIFSKKKFEETLIKNYQNNN